MTRTGSMVVLSGATAAAACGPDGPTVTLRRDTGAPIGDDERLRVATSDFLATGGDTRPTGIPLGGSLTLPPGLLPPHPPDPPGSTDQP